MARFFNEDHEKVFVLAPQMDDDEDNFLVRYNNQLIEIFSSHNDPHQLQQHHHHHQQQDPTIEIEAYSSTTTSTEYNNQSAGLNEYYYKGVRRIIAGHIQFRSEAQAERAYALFNDTSIIVTKSSTTTSSSRKTRIRLELLYYDQTPIDIDDNNTNNNNEILPALLHIRGVPPSIHHWFPETFDTFRKQGRLIKCQRRHRCAIHQSNMQKLSEQCSDNHDPTIIVQYMSKEESDKAMSELNGSKLFEACTLSIIVKNTSSYSPEKSSNHGRRPSSFIKIKTSGHVRLSHDSLASPSASSTSSTSTTFQQQRSQQRYQQRQIQQQQQKKSIDGIEKQPDTPNSTTTISTITSNPTKVTTMNKSQRLELKPAMDLCNIYIKHIDPSIKSTELFNLFKPFGRIISARVMEDPSTSTSRGFGFVSYSHPTEAAAALLEMDGYTGPKEEITTAPSLPNTPQDEDEKKQANKDWVGEPMSVRFHEPRVPRPERDHQQQVLKLFQSHLANRFSFDHVLPTMTPDNPSTATSLVEMNSPAAVAATSAGGLVHHGTSGGGGGGGGGGGIGHHHHHHHPPPPPPLMMPSHHQHSPTAYYSPYSPSPTQPSQPVSPFTLQHHPYMYPPHSPYVIPHSPRGTTANSTYYYYYPQQQTHVMPEYYTPPLPPPQQQLIHHSHQQYQQPLSQPHRPYSPTKYQQQQSPQQQSPTVQQEQQHQLQKAEEGFTEQQEKVITATTSTATTANDGEDDKQSIASDISVHSNTANETAGEVDGGRQRLLEVIQQKLPQTDAEKIATVADKLMTTLNRKERSLCLFNDDYLEHRIKQVFECQL